MHYIHQKGNSWLVNYVDYEDLLQPVRRHMSFQTREDAEAFSATLASEQVYRETLMKSLEELREALFRLPKPRTTEEKALNAYIGDRMWNAIRLAQRGPLVATTARKHRVVKRGGFKREEFRTKERLLFLEQSNKTCTYCERSSGTIAHDPDGFAWHIDHVDPVSRGGKHQKSNWTIACRACNLEKHNKPVDVWRGDSPARQPVVQETVAIPDVKLESLNVPIERLAFTPEEASAILGITGPQLRAMIHRGDIGVIQLSANCQRIPRKELERFIAS